MKAIKLNKQDSAVIDRIVGSLLETGGAKVAGLGTFKIKQAKERQGVNPKTGEKITIAAHNKIKFSAAKDLKEKVLKFRGGSVN